MTVVRKHWLNHAKEIVRSRHYTWLPQGLGGESVEEAMTWMTTDIMHICKLANVPFDQVLEDARRRFNEEEAAQHPAKAPTGAMTHVLENEFDGDAVITAYETNDMYEAEIVRGILQSEGISCRLDSQAQGGFTELVDTRVLVHARDADRAYAAIHRPASEVEKRPE